MSDPVVCKQPTFDKEIVVGGLTPLTTIDYPGELAAVIFMQGCPWRCGYCQNAELLPRKNKNTIAWSDIITLLEKRRELLDAVVFSGGEPTLQPGLKLAMQQVKKLGFKIGLHTAGIYPDRLIKLLPLLDWVALDMKSAQADYEKITGVKNSGDRAWKSARAIIDSGIAYEFRTTVHPDMLDQQQILKLVNELTELGTENYVIQGCVTTRCLDNTKRVVTSAKLDQVFLNQFTDKFRRFGVRKNS